MGNLGESFDTAWNVVKEEPDESTDAWDDVHYRGKDNCDSCGSYRDPNSDYCRECFDGATPRNRENPHLLDGKLDDVMLSSSDAYSLWDEGYEPNYDLVIQSAIELLENMGYKVTPPNNEGMGDNSELENDHDLLRLLISQQKYEEEQDNLD